MGGDEGAKDAITETRADPSTVLRCAFWLVILISQGFHQILR